MLQFSFFYLSESHNTFLLPLKILHYLCLQWGFGICANRKIIYSFIYSSVHSLICSFTALIHSFIHSFISFIIQLTLVFAGITFSSLCNKLLWLINHTNDLIYCACSSSGIMSHKRCCRVSSRYSNCYDQAAQRSFWEGLERPKCKQRLK